MNHQVALLNHLGIESDKYRSNFLGSSLYPPKFPSVFSSISRDWAKSFVSACTFDTHAQCQDSSSPAIWSNPQSLNHMVKCELKAWLQRAKIAKEIIIVSGIWLTLLVWIFIKMVSKTCWYALRLCKRVTFGTFGLSVGFGFSALIIRSRVDDFTLIARS